jgi:hypothetical protein
LFHHDRALRLNAGREACYIFPMSFTRSVTFVILCAAQVGQGSLAAPYVAAAPPDASPLIEPVARKGTRAYTAGDTTATPPVQAPLTSPSTKDDALAQCISTWDAGTHITKSKWREICVRQLKENDQ